eukprot:CAMPEP_0177306080 /NCGR_PEP_ID=MMETSP0368-20130122/7518_1 /TAXON_ID=447022 ORGANISM="Scrippsiella hangoei-like, Strain SHHI-4" /NCGR_SAMPLE_ID=MMETSP0368 /ASSEMBLY_ACC=CAM_ASM_000363 /LENGTH=477 /DNA_ID=CAMNT_0018764755 /DNA_START=57 /DNA_END=1488 /DNA_ORIENTATION=-
MRSGMTANSSAAQRRLCTSVANHEKPPTTSDVHQHVLCCRMPPILRRRRRLLVQEIDQGLDRKFAVGVRVQVIKQYLKVGVALLQVQGVPAEAHELCPIDCLCLASDELFQKAFPLLTHHYHGCSSQSGLQPQQRLVLGPEELLRVCEQVVGLIADAELLPYFFEYVDEAAKVDTLLQAPGLLVEDEDDVPHADGQVEPTAQVAELKRGHMVVGLVSASIEDELQLLLHGPSLIGDLLGQPHHLLDDQSEFDALDVRGPPKEVFELQWPNAIETQGLNLVGLIATISPSAAMVPHFIGSEVFVEEFAPVEDDDQFLHGHPVVTLLDEACHVGSVRRLETDIPSVQTCSPAQDAGLSAADLVSTIAWPVSSEGSSRSIADARRVRQFLREASLLSGVLGLAGRVSAPAFSQSGSSPLALCTIHAAIDLFKFMLATHRRESLPTCLVKEGKQVSPFASVNIFCRSLPKPSIAIACRSHA